jgi:tRNA A37 threonylcarbamoyladenosine biosynthesis protein TsaE
LLKSYGPPFVHHIDAYRLEGGQSSADVEDAMDDAEAIIFIEWASNIKDALPQARIELQFRHISDHEKEVTILKEGPIDVKKLLND